MHDYENENDMNAVSLQEKWEEIILRTAKLLVLHPEKVEVYTSTLNDEMILVKVHTTSDRGKLIGKGGAYSNGIKAILDIANRRNGTHIVIDYNPEPSVDVKEAYPSVPPTCDWNSAEVAQLASEFAEQTFDGPFTLDIIDGDPKKPEERFVSVIRIITSENEEQERIRTFNQALAPLFRGIGMGLGRKQLVVKAKSEDGDPR